VIVMRAEARSPIGVPASAGMNLRMNLSKYGYFLDELHGFLRYYGRADRCEASGLRVFTQEETHPRARPVYP